MWLYGERNLSLIVVVLLILIHKYKYLFQSQRPLNNILQAGKFNAVLLIIVANEGLQVPSDEEYLLQLLRPCHFYAQSAYDKLLRYFKLKAKYEKGFEDVLPTTVRHVFEQHVIRLLPKRDQHGVRILVVDCGSKFCAWNWLLI